MTQNPYESPDSPETNAMTVRRSRSFLLEALVVAGILAVIAALILPATRSARPSAYRISCMNNIKNITLALLNYADTHKTFPPAYTVDARGNRLHSWRTLLLPYLDQQSLYQSIDFSKPWNDPANTKAYNSQLEVFSCYSADLKPGFTTYLGNATTNGCFTGSRPKPLSEITDLHNQTVLIAEVASHHAVHWMAPDDADENILLSFEPGNATAHNEIVNAGFVDGSVSALSSGINRDVANALLTVSGNESFNGKDF